MFTTIVVGLDGSDDARRALDLAVELARRGGARLVLAHVEQDIVGKGGTAYPPTEDEIQAEVRRAAEELAQQGLQADAEIRGTVLEGPPEVLEAIARDAGADLIVVGNRGRSVVAGLILGSVPLRLLHIAHRPVLVVPPPRG
jgi:nucleotide-binding universal stress UspA family protein